MILAIRRALMRLRATDLNYGRDIIVKFCADYARRADGSLRILDIGCSHGIDLTNVRDCLGSPCELFGVECDADRVSVATANGIKVFFVDIERAAIPADDGFFDIVIINQVIEHSKELFWIFSEISRLLKKGGACIVGTSNLASLHNRALLLFGEQPSAIEVLGPPVRGFTAPSFKRFIEADGYFKLLKVRGSNFYPFPPCLARTLSKMFPRLSVGLFFLLRREDKDGVFIQVLENRDYETPYFRGDRR